MPAGLPCASAAALDLAAALPDGRRGSGRGGMAGRILDIAIAGAGPAGPGGGALSRSGPGTASPSSSGSTTPAPVGSGLILQPTGLTVLDDLGLLADIIALGSRIDRLHGADATSGRTVLDVRYDAQQGRPLRACRASRRAVRRAVCAPSQAAGIAIETGIDLETVDAAGQTGGARRCRRPQAWRLRPGRRRDRRPFEAEAAGQAIRRSRSRWPMARSGRRSAGVATALTRMRCCSATTARA